MPLSFSIRPFASVVLAVLIALGAALTSARPAHATDPLEVSVFCEGVGGGSTFAQFICDAYASGGTGTYTYTWTGSTYVEIFGNGSSARGNCRVRFRASATVTVQDSAGNTASATGPIRCWAVAP
ncbi:MAG TPA: hypothetical protein VFS21_20700 [Roseiflexaceae bacterium]|nr:hypothetical protein [Roseiflexaceae bacterium]